MANIAILGGGYTALSAAKELKVDNKITIFEKNQKLGGMASSFNFNGYSLEKLYHHIFKSDSFVIDLANELGVSSNFIWPLTQMGYFTDGKIYKFGTPKSLLKFSPLSFIEKLNFGFSILKIKSIKNYKSLENIGASQWLKKNAGKNAFEKIWEPLLKSKFGNHSDKVAMSWLWGKIVLRSSSGTSEGEHLGYMNGSYEVLTNALCENLQSSDNVEIKENCEILSISKANGKYSLKTSTDNYEGYDAIISTIAYPIFLKLAKGLISEEDQTLLGNINYTAARCTILSLKYSFMPYYWLNIGDPEIPFGGLIEHTNMVKPDNYGGKHILYISNYLFLDDPLYKCGKSELISKYIPFLKKINPLFNKNWIDASYDFEESYAQPIIEKGYSKKIPPMHLTGNNIFIAGMPQIYPEDRGLNYAIKLGKQVAAEASKALKKL